MFVGSCTSGLIQDQICLICLDATLIPFMYTVSALIDWCDITHSSPDEKNCIDQLFGGRNETPTELSLPFFQVNVQSSFTVHVV